MVTWFTNQLLNNIYSVNLKTQALNSTSSFNWCGVILVENRLKNCGCLSLPNQRVHLESQRIKTSIRKSFKFSVSWELSGLYFSFSWTKLVLKYEVINMQYCSKPVHPVTYTVQSFWSDHSSVYLCYFHLNQPCGPNLIWGYLPPIYLKIRTSVCVPGIKWDSFFQDATSWRQYQGGPALALTSSFTWRQRIFGARMSESSCFYEVTLQRVQALQKTGASVLNGKKREDVLPLLSLLCDKGTM